VVFGSANSRAFLFSFPFLPFLKVGTIQVGPKLARIGLLGRDVGGPGSIIERRFALEEERQTLERW
jgi:hypothetical protein